MNIWAYHFIKQNLIWWRFIFPRVVVNEIPDAECIMHMWWRKLPSSFSGHGTNGVHNTLNQFGSLNKRPFEKQDWNRCTATYNDSTFPYSCPRHRRMDVLGNSPQVEITVELCTVPPGTRLVKIRWNSCRDSYSPPTNSKYPWLTLRNLETELFRRCSPPPRHKQILADFFWIMSMSRGVGKVRF